MTTLTSAQHLVAPGGTGARPLSALLRRLAHDEGGALYAIVDAARSDEVLRLLAHGDVEHASIYQGQKLQRLLSVAPFLTRFEPEAAVCRWLIAEAWGRSCGMLLTSAAAMPELVAHLASLVTAEDDHGVRDFFRFHDPRVLPLYLPTCTGDELNRFFGPVSRMMTESDTAERLLVFGREGAAEASGGPLRLRQQQLDALLLGAEGDFLERLHAHLARHFPRQCARWGEERVRRRIREGVIEGTRRGIQTERGLAELVRVAFSRRF